jgi:hypothetical protein
MSENHQGERDPLEDVIEAFHRMTVPDRPPDREVLARLSNDRSTKAQPIPTPAPKRAYLARPLLSYAAALLVACGVGLCAFVLNSTAPMAVADVVKASKTHKLVRYKQQQTAEASASAGVRLDSRVYADLTAARLRSECRIEDADGEATLVSVLDPVRHLETNSRHKTAWLRLAPKGYKSFCCSLQEFEHHTGVTWAKDKLGDLATVKYHFEDDNESSSLWVDVATHLPVRMEQELIHAAPEAMRTRFVWTDFEWDPELPNDFTRLDEFFSTRPPEGYTLIDQIRNEQN